MEEVKQLMEVLDRVESKLLAARKIYLALQFQAWVVIMSLYYLLLSFLPDVSWQFTAIYWTVGFVIFIYCTSIIWRRLSALYNNAGKVMRNPAAFGWSIAASWGIGAFVGWFIVPYFLSFGYPEVANGVGYLVFIGVSVLGMFLAHIHFVKRVEGEMIPAFLLPLLGIAGIGMVNVYPMVYAGYVVAFSFSLTVALYIYSTFKTIG